MQHIKTREIFFSLDQPDKILPTLLALFEEIRETASSNGKGLTPSHAHTILLLDADSQRVRHIAYLLTSAGYQPFIATNTLEAFTFFLRGAFVPFVIILGQYDTNSRFFLTRLLQQIMQKYHWNTPLIDLHTQPRTLSAPNTDPLPPPPPASYSHRTHVLPQTPVTASLPFMPETPQLFLGSGQSTQTAFPPVPATPSAALSARTTGPTPIINISTHDVQKEQKIVQKISLEGQSIGRYHMQTLLGSGPLGQVYRTYDRLREQDVALKAIQMNALPQNAHTSMTSETNFFQQELDMLSVLNHPHILLPLNCGKSYISGSPFVYKTMPYCADGSMATFLHELSTTRLLSPQEVIPLIIQIADALQHAHAHNIIYQNFKLSNLLIRTRKKSRSKEDIHILLTDFAVPQQSSFLIKTPDTFPYIAPERWQGQSLPASDQYGLAAITYELLAGRVLFQGHSEQIMRQLHTTMQPQALTLFTPYVSPALSNVILRALSKRMEDRFPSIMQFVQALQRQGN